MPTDTVPPNLTPAQVAQWEAAGKATPGPYWEPWLQMAFRYLRKHIDYQIEDEETPEDTHPPWERADVANLMANADPDTVRATLREISELRGKLASVTAERDRLRGLIVAHIEASRLVDDDGNLIPGNLSDATMPALQAEASRPTTTEGKNDGE